MVGSNGAGKTNLLEALHVGTQGFSPRTRSDAQLVRFGSEAGRIRLRGTRDGAPVETEVTLSPREGKRGRLNGARLQAAEQLRTELQTLVFTPDRLAVVKGAPAVRRAYFDRVLGRLLPARGSLPAEYGAAVGQRNAALRRIAAGLSSRDALVPWTERVVEIGAWLTEARSEAVAALAAPVAERASALGLEGVRLEYKAEPPSVGDFDERLQRELDRGTTSLGPHLDDIGIIAGARELRSFGSQGEQRAAVLSLLLAEAALVEQARGVAPLLLLDDVLSELDGQRRRVLREWLPRAGQTFVTATDAAMLEHDPDQLLLVSPGTVKAA